MDKEKQMVTVSVGEQSPVVAIEQTQRDIRSMIYVIRNQQVMLDSDLAMLYQVETGNLNKAMKRNQKRFPVDFCFQLSKEQFENLRFQFGSSSLNRNEYGGRRYMPIRL